MLKKNISNIKRKLNGFDSFNYKKISSTKIKDTRKIKDFPVSLGNQIFQRDFQAFNKLNTIKNSTQS